MSTGRIGSQAPLPSTRLLDINDLPGDLIDIELSAPPTKLVGDIAAVLLRPDEGPPAAILKIARGPLTASVLRTQRRVLAEFAIHQAITEEWRDLLPRVLACDDRREATVSVESYVPGMDLADVLATCPSRADELTAAALTAIAPLHRQTATSVIVDNVCLLRRWVIEPLADLTHMCQRLDPSLVPVLERLGKLVRQALVGWRMPVSWTHGDYTPGNVRVAGAEGPVTGIVNWGGARPGQPALIDEYLMILTARSQVEGTDLGAVVAERIREGGLTDQEHQLLLAARGQQDTSIGHHAFIDDRVAVLLAWLHYVACLWRKHATHPNHHTWWATMVAPVLDAVAPLQEFSGSHARGRASRTPKA